MQLREILPFIDANKGNMKVHCAIGRDHKYDPLYAFSKGSFKSWQEDQRNKNFERDYILSIIFYNRNEWLFAGLYKSIGVHEINERYNYDTELLDEGRDLIGRLVVGFEKDFRASYLKLENHIDDFYISEILKKPYKIDPFPGFENINIPYSLLKEVIAENEPSWKSALSNVKGVYLISDQSTGKLYVGAAYGQEAFWNRWHNYVETGHGGNVLLKEILGENSIAYAANFNFSILEIVRMNADDSYIQNREAFWKNILLSRKFGYNKN